MWKRCSASVAVTIVSLLLALPVRAHADEGHHDFSDVEQLIEQRVACDELTDDQLERIGDYEMERIHPGEAHEQMDDMMGGEGSVSLRTMHIAMAQRLYCGERGADSDVMMDGMMGSMHDMAQMMDAPATRAAASSPDPTASPVLHRSFESWPFRALVWAFLLAGIAAFMKYLISKQ